MSVQHDLQQITQTGLHGGPTWRYRGVEILSNAAGTLFTMPQPPAGMPGRWSSLGNKEHIMQVVDAWLDTGRLPAPYRIPGG